MTDGNTALPVSPVTKEEAMNLHGMFTKAAQAIVAASEYPAQVESLRQQVESLQRDLSNKTVHAEELDRTVHELREQRDTARNTIVNLEGALSHNRYALDQAQRTVMEQQNTISHQAEVMDLTKRERDEYGMQVLALEEQVAAWRDKAEKARVRLNDVLSVFKADEPKPVPPEPAPAPPEPTPVPPTPVLETASQSAPEPAMQPAPEPAPEVEVLAEWEPGAQWDFEHGAYTRPKMPF